MDVAVRPDRRAPGWLVWANLWIVYVVWGSTYLAIRVMVATIPPLLAGGVRFVIAGTIAYAWLAARRGRGALRITRSELAGCGLVGTALILGGNGLVSIAERDVPSGLAALVIASTPLWVVLLRAVAGEHVAGTTLAGVGIGFVGVGVLVLGGDGEGGGGLFGLLLLIAAAASWASGSFFSKRIALPEDPFVSTVVQMLLGGTAMLVAGLLRGEGFGFDVDDVAVSSVAALVYLIVVGSLVAFTAYTWLLQHAPISKVATYAYVNPVIAIILGWALLSERITARILLGAALVVTSVAFIITREKGPADLEAAEAAPEGALAGVDR